MKYDETKIVIKIHEKNIIKISINIFIFLFISNVCIFKDQILKNYNNQIFNLTSKLSHIKKNLQI